MRLSPLRSGLVGFVLWIGSPAAGLAQRPHFDAQRDYAYDLGATDAAVVAVELTAGGFAWPEKAPAGDTAFLEIVDRPDGSRA